MAQSKLPTMATIAQTQKDEGRGLCFNGGSLIKRIQWLYKFVDVGNDKPPGQPITEYLGTRGGNPMIGNPTEERKTCDLRSGTTKIFASAFGSK